MKAGLKYDAPSQSKRQNLLMNDIPLEAIPQSLRYLLTGVQLASLVLFGYVLVKLHRRKLAGSLGSEVGSPWGGTEAALLMGIVLMLYSQVILWSQILKKYGYVHSPTREAFVLLSGQVLLYLAFLAAVHTLLRRKGSNWTETFGFDRSSLGSSLLAALIGVLAVIFPLSLLGRLTVEIFEFLRLEIEPQPILEFLWKIEHPGLKLGMILVAIAGAPLIEEILCRGIIYPWLKARFGFGHALWLNALLFSLIHFHPPNILTLFFLAVGFTLAYEWRGNLFTSIAMHAGFNSFSLLLLSIRGTNP
jgi:uncharacterized protein